MYIVQNRYGYVVLLWAKPLENINIYAYSELEVGEIILKKNFNRFIEPV